MARGWESKAIESQQEEAARDRVKKPALTAEQRADLERRRTLELSRARAEADLARATSSAHRRMLEQTISAIDEQLSQLSS
ncbi:MAG TPA: hypothetical protein VFJ02_11510 [Vicinamibacterales bacterium]|nr:hypothetical protein [Vicinamibacterales bacterium]